MKDTLRTVFIVSFLLFSWQFDRTQYVQHDMYNHVVFASTIIFGVAYVLLEIISKEVQELRSWKTWLNVIITTVLIVFFLNRLVLNAYSLSILVLVGITGFIPIVCLLIRKK